MKKYSSNAAKIKERIPLVCFWQLNVWDVNPEIEMDGFSYNKGRLSDPSLIGTLDAQCHFA